MGCSQGFVACNGNNESSIDYTSFIILALEEECEPLVTVTLADETLCRVELPCAGILYNFRKALYFYSLIDHCSVPCGLQG